MNPPLRIEATIQNDGELVLSNLPCHKGDHVEAIITVCETEDETQRRNNAKNDFLTIARSTNFRSTSPYPSRDALHERH